MTFKEKLTGLLNKWEQDFVENLLLYSGLYRSTNLGDPDFNLLYVNEEHQPPEKVKENTEINEKFNEDFKGIVATYCNSYGGEDQGSDYWSVYEFSQGDEKLLVKTQGWYASHYGTDYQNWKFVEPKEKTIIVYE
jgi:hypothetical protein